MGIILFIPFVYMFVTYGPTLAIQAAATVDQIFAAFTPSALKIMVVACFILAFRYYWHNRGRRPW